MKETSRAPTIYALSQGVRVFKSGEEIRFRKGVWNHNEAVVRLTGQEERVIRFFTKVLDAIKDGKNVDPNAIGLEVGASADEISSYNEVLKSLAQQQFLYDVQQPDVTRVIQGLLGGSVSGFEAYVGVPRPMLCFADTEYARTAARMLATDLRIPLDILEEADTRAMAMADLTTQIDAVAHADTLAKFANLFSSYACVLGCVASPNLTFLRNLNRVLIQLEKPLVLGLIDGPFVSLLSTLPTQTGCFECYEQRMLARLQDTLAYHQFVQATATNGGASATRLSPALHMLTAGVIGEGSLYTSLGMMRLAGRIVNIYLPLLEIQVQDLLRVPYCPACGFISKAKMNEMYTSSKRLVDEMLTKVALEE